MTGYQGTQLGYTPRDLRARFDQYLRVCAFQQSMNKDEGLQQGHTPHSVKRIFREYLHFLDRVRDGKYWPSPLPATFVDGIEGYERSWRGRAQLISPSYRSVVAVDKPEMAMRKLMWYFWGATLVKRFCSTTEGRLGWVPRRAKPGDLICVFDGADMPFVIRPRNEEGSRKFSFTYWYRQLSGSQSPSLGDTADPEYILVGQCYVHGLMGGEALERTDLESKLITLS